MTAVLFTPLLNIKTINIETTDEITSKDIAYRSLESIRWKHLLFTEKIDIETPLKNYQKNIKDVEVDFKLLNSINITLSSYRPIFKTIINEKIYMITENGVFIPWDNDELKKINIMIDKKEISILDYKQILNQEYIKRIDEIYKKIIDKLIVLGVKDLDYFVTERELILTTNNNSKIIFDLEWEIDFQIAKLIEFHKEQQDLIENPVVYIDLRIMNKIYFCPLKEEFQCKYNLKKIYSIEFNDQ